MNAIDMIFPDNSLPNYRIMSDWRKAYRGINGVEELLYSIANENGLLIENEKGTVDWDEIEETKERKTTIYGGDRFKGLTIEFSYHIPLTPNSKLSLIAESKTEGSTSILSHSPEVIINAICSIVSMHDDQKGNWIPITPSSTDPTV